ncbi:hypothetical protein RO3G_15401 [Lichtheimia corymbifera JMRC:FSU:9682]|uniref:Uncharacterized protein n=1 Tax=Lichtheimia corymbifera JMRC:FSU:9682 TaxID=1263082 RepID=A0A068RZG8_9FUNG|nr:hypothetical protein RO3G_15401 [Lichtheimia corymbifera JMRC:FSU:9682]
MATNNSLLQFAQVITDHHYDPSPPSPQRVRSESSPHPTLRSENSRLDHRRSYLPIRKNACVVCGICFTCSNTYGMNCRCEEMQPRRGRNLPEGSLDSRAKKLHPRDKEDYAFSIEWLSLHAHPMHKNSTGQVIGLRNLPEVSLCKAHSSTLYRAKKRHERSKASCSPTTSTTAATTTNTTNTNVNTVNHSNNDTTNKKIPEGGIGGLAAKVREIMSQQQYPPPPPPPPPSDLSIQASTSLKRKRPSPPIHSSASTPLYATAPPMLRHSAPSSSYSHQLPPLQQQQHHQEPSQQQHHARTPSLSSLSSSLQEQLRLSPLRVQSVSLKAISSNLLDPPQYYVRNLAITDTFTFRDLLNEVDMTGPPPPGKRIVIIDDKTDTLFPLDQAIRNVIKRPSSAHIELSLALSDKAAIDWSTYT